MPKKVKKIIYIIIGIAIGSIITLTLTTNAASQLASSSVGYDNTNSGSTKTTVKDAIDELYEKANICQNSTEFEVGDYVSMTPTKTSFTIPSTLTGYTSNQTINPSELNLWRVIKINDDNTVDMVSEYVSSMSVYFQGSTGYQNAIGTLNYIAKQYENEKYTVNSRYMGYNNQTEYITTSLTTSNSGTSSTNSSTTSSQEAKGSGDTWYTTDTGLVKMATGSITAYSVSDKTTVNAYWLASRYYYYISSAYYFWSLRYVSTDGGIYYNHLYSFSSSGYSSESYNKTLRPIITLKSGIKATGTGTSEDPYVLN
jgi:hypothetical protein